MKVIVTLEDVVVLDNPPVLLAHIRAQDRGGEFRVILRCQQIADIVQQGADNSFPIGSIAQAAGRSLQRVNIAVNSGCIMILILQQLKLAHQVIYRNGRGGATDLDGVLR